MTKSRFTISLSWLLTVAMLAGCAGDPAVQMRHRAEELLYQAESSTRAAQLNPRRDQSDGYRRLGDDYRKALGYCYAVLDSIDADANGTEYAEISIIAFRAASRLSQLAFASKEYDSSANYSEQLIDRVQLQGEARISAYLNLGQALQATGRWDSALTVYEYSIDEFYPPLDIRGRPIEHLLNLPAHIYEVYTRVGDTLRAAVAYDRAEAYYQGLVNGYESKPILARYCRARLASLNQRVGNWEGAIEHLRLILDSAGNTAGPARLQIADIWAGLVEHRSEALAEYNRLLDELSPTDSLVRPMLLYKKSMVLLNMGDYPEARSLLNTLESDYKSFFVNTPNAQYAIARSFDLEGRWERAEQEYRFVIENYPGSEQGMSTYLYLAEKYTERGRHREAARLESEAEAEYDRLAAARVGTPQETLALNYKAELFRRKKAWPSAAEILVSIFNKQPDSDLGQRSLITAAVIYRDKLDNQTVADSLVEVLKTRMTPFRAGQENQDL